jgi:hypothetical protein
MLKPTPVSSWNGPHSGVIPPLPRASMTWGDASKPLASKWKPGPWKWEDVHWRYDVGGSTEATAAQFQEAVSKVGAFDIVNLFCWDQWWDESQHGTICPKDLDDEGVDRTFRLFRELRPYAGDALILTDHEDSERTAKCYVTSGLLRASGYPINKGANYATTHLSTPVQWMVHAPSCMDWATTFLNLYDMPQINPDTFNAWMAAFPKQNPLILAVSNASPHLEAFLKTTRAWKDAGGKLLHVTVWNHKGAPDPKTDEMIVAALNGPARVTLSSSRKTKAGNWTGGDIRKPPVGEGGR